jgi:hypothetical protein
MRSISAVLAIACVILGCGGSSPSGPSSGAQSTLQVTIPSLVLASGTTVQAEAAVTGPSGGSTPAANVVWSSSSPGVATVNASGVITGRRAGNATISAKSGTMYGSKMVTVVPGAPAKVVIYAGELQSGPAGTRLRDPLCTTVQDDAGNMIIGARVTYSVATGGGGIDEPSAPATAADDGVARSGAWLLGPVVGNQTVIASSVGAQSVTFTAKAQ